MSQYSELFVTDLFLHPGSYFTRKEFLPNHLKERPITEEDVPLMPSEEAALRKKEEELAMKEAVKEEMFIQHMANNNLNDPEATASDEEIDKEFEALKETKLTQLFNNMRARQAKEDAKKAGKQ